MLLEEARQAYDIVIIDTPPVMTSADAALMGRSPTLACSGEVGSHLLADDGGSWVSPALRRRSGGIVMVGVDTGSAGYGQLASYGYDTASSEGRSMRPPSHRSLTEAE
jgi:hypothetical protein